MFAQPTGELGEIEHLAEVDAELEQAMLMQRHVRPLVAGGHRLQAVFHGVIVCNQN